MTQKATKSDLERRMKKALVLVPRDKDYIGVFFDDKGVRLEATNDACVISTGFHRHVFQAVTATGYSRPFLYTRKFIQFALENDCTVTDDKGNVTRSYKKLLEVLKQKEDRSDFNIAFYYDLWLFNIFSPLYAIDENVSASYIVHEEYLHNIARNNVILEEHKEDVTYREYMDAVIDHMKSFVDDELGKVVVFQKLTDEERAKQELEALQEQEAQENANK